MHSAIVITKIKSLTDRQKDRPAYQVGLKCDIAAYACYGNLKYDPKLSLAIYKDKVFLGSSAIFA